MSFKDKIVPTVKILEDAAKAVPFPEIVNYEMPTEDEIKAHHEASSKQMPFYNQASTVEWMASMLDEVLPKSFKPLTKQEITENCWLAKCEKCYWWGSSMLLNGGERDYWGEYDDLTCPICGTHEVIAIDNKKIKFVEVDL